MSEVALSIRDWDKDTINMMHKLRRYATRLQAEVPRDGLDRPLALVNIPELQASGLSASLDFLLEQRPPHLFLPITVQDDIPTIYGTPIWEILEGEPVEYYNLFKIYRSLATKAGARSIYKVSKETGIEPRKLEILRQTYFWSLRAEAFDAYREKEEQLLLAWHQRVLLQDHRKTATALFDMATKYIENNADKLTPTTALKWAELAIKLGRLSVGLHPDKPDTTYEDRPTVNIVNTVNTSDAHGTGATGDINEDRQRLKQLLNVMNNIGLFQAPEVVEVEEGDIVVESADD